jgi:CMP-N,N'-diacetyllegionaminic acid synthase
MKRLAGSPLIVWTLEAATSARLVERIIVTSDDPDLLALAQLYAKVETLWRDPLLAGDDVPDYPVVMDALHRSSVALGPDDGVLFLRPTAPLRKPEEINHVAELLLAHAGTDSVRSVCRPKFHPQKAYLWAGENHLTPYTSDHKANHPSQSLAAIAYPTGFIDAVRVRVLRAGIMEGPIIRPWLSPLERSIDLDTLEDWEEAEAICRAHNYGPGRIRP